MSKVQKKTVKNLPEYSRKLCEICCCAPRWLLLLLAILLCEFTASPLFAGFSRWACQVCLGPSAIFLVCSTLTIPIFFACPQWRLLCNSHKSCFHFWFLSYIFNTAFPELFGRLLSSQIQHIQNQTHDHQLISIPSFSPAFLPPSLPPSTFHLLAEW